MTPARRSRLMLAVLAGVLLTTLVVAPVDARMPRPRHYRIGGHLSLDTNLLSASGASAWAIDEYLAAHTSLPPLGAAFMAAERKYGINARFLLAAAMHESGWGTGFIARVKHNLFGYNAYDRDPFKYANAYATYTANIDDTERFIKDFYLTPTGRWWGGRPTLRSMQQFWSSSGRWGVLVSRIATSLRLDTLRSRRISFAAPVVSGLAHTRGNVFVGLRWTGGALPASIRFVATWEPVELDSTVVAAAAATAPVAGFPGDVDAAVATTGTPGAAAAAPGGNPAPAGDWVANAQRVRNANHMVTVSVPTPAAPGRYVLHLELRDAGGGPLPARDRLAIPGVAIRAWANRAVGYSIEAGAGGKGAIVRITNTGRTTIPAAGDQPAAVSNNPELAAPRTVITVSALTGDPAPATPQVLAMTRLRADLAPGASVTVAVPAVGAAAWTASQLSVAVSVLGDATWLGATSTGGFAPSPVAVAPTPTGTPNQLPAPTPSTTPTPTPSITPKPAPAPTPAPTPTPAPSRKPRHETKTFSERTGAVTYHGAWADAASGSYGGGHVRWSSSTGASATFTFTGTSVAWIGPVGPTRGRVAVLLDGRVVARLSLWRSSFDPQVVLYRRSFASQGRHRLTIQVLSAPGPGVVAIDGFVVRS